jgi:hypothetical protein
MMNENENTTDATRGSGLRIRVEARKQELEQALIKLGPDDRARADIEQALNGITGLLTGNLDQIPRVVATELSRWLEAHKHVDEWHPRQEEAPPAEPHQQEDHSQL